MRSQRRPAFQLNVGGLRSSDDRDVSGSLERRHEVRDGGRGSHNTAGDFPSILPRMSRMGGGARLSTGNQIPFFDR